MNNGHLVVVRVNCPVSIKHQSLQRSIKRYYRWMCKKLCMCRAGGWWEIRVQVCVRSRGLVLHGVPRQSAAGAEDGHGAADQRGGHGAVVALWRKHGLRPGWALLPAPPVQRGLRLLTHRDPPSLSNSALVCLRSGRAAGGQCTLQTGPCHWSSSLYVCTFMCLLLFSILFGTCGARWDRTHTNTRPPTELIPWLWFPVTDTGNVQQSHDHFSFVSKQPSFHPHVSEYWLVIPLEKSHDYRHGRLLW